MKKILTVCMAMIMVATLLISCAQDSASFSGNTTSQESITYTAKFDYAIPSGNISATYNDTVYNPATDNIPDIRKEKGSVIELPSCAIKFTIVASGAKYVFDYWVDIATGTHYNSGSLYTLNKNVIFRAQYKLNEEPAPPTPGEDPNTLDICTKTTYSMKIGETVKLKASWSDACRYEVSENEYDAISLGADNVITANTVGTAIVKIISLENASKRGECLITVTSDTFSGSGLDYKLVGTWKNGQDRLELHTDKSGYIKAYLNGTVIHDASFNWTTWTQDNGHTKYKYFKISNGPTYLNKDFTILSVSSTKLKLKGYLAFGKPLETEWTKE